MFFIGVNDNNLNVTVERTKVGMILNSEINDNGWGQSHYEGLKKAAEELNLDVTYLENISAGEECVQAIDNLVDKGCRIIIGASYDFNEDTFAGAQIYPEVYFYQVSGTHHTSNLASYFGRMYQMRYLSGIVAGLQTESDKIGYVATYPVDEVIRGINAFALGVRAVNPEATVYVAYTNSWVGSAEAELTTNYLLRRKPNIDVITMHTNSMRPHELAETLKIWSIGINMDNSAKFPKSYLTAPVWSWEKFYTPHLLECLQGKFEGATYWDGVETGLVSLSPLTGNVKPGAQEKVDAALTAMKDGKFDVFYGPIHDQTGNVCIPEGDSMSDELMLEHFDWYVEGVIVYDRD